LIILDENILDGQRQLLEASGFAVRQIGHDFLSKGLKDEQIVTHLRAFRRSKFVTRDAGFFRKNLCHRGYCVTVVNANQYELAAFARRFLRHPNFNAQVKRSGKVVRIGPTGIVFWTAHRRSEANEPWGPANLN
jgi:hypothetical protein